ncbi:MAG: DUF1801 domain-containing protein [Bacteroidia bacterium]|nr:DUF1801 domain-containing protein [Bacteroidia bacterium]
MRENGFPKIQNLAHLYEYLPENQRIIVEVLRQFILENLPDDCREKISYNVPFFYGTKGICILWPSAVPRGGIQEGVLLGFWYGNRLSDPENYLTKGSNKQIFYKIFHSAEDIETEPLLKILTEAIRIDRMWKAN